MKRYIYADTKLKQGSYVADKDGEIYDIGMHVPSTTYLGRGYLHLAPTDADFLYKHGKISEEDVAAICLYCYEEFLEDEIGISERDQMIPLMAITQFADYAELKYAKDARKIFFKYNNVRTLEELEEKMSELPDFNSLNSKWYKWLQNNFVKISKFGNTVEFRISSNDGTDWNKTIIDDIILKFDNGGRSKTKYNILRESDKGYQEYFFNATLNDILEQDKMVLSSEYLDRSIVNGNVKYNAKRFVSSSNNLKVSMTLEQWVQTLSPKITTLYLHHTDGRIIGKMPIEQAIENYGTALVTSSYSEGNGLVSVWIIS